LKLSVTTYPWRKIPTPGRLGSVLSTIRKIGYEGVGLEYAYLPKSIRQNPQLVRPIISKSGLENGGTFSPGALTRVKWAKESGTPLIWVSIYSQDRKVALTKLKKFVETAKQSGVVATLHNEVRSAFQTVRDIEQAMRSIKDLTLCLDTAHGTAAGMDVNATIEKYADRIKLVHLKDFRGKVSMRDVKFTRDFVNLGHGIVDIRGAIERLKAVKYTGELMVEVEANEGQSPVEVVREGYEYVKGLL
jgi:sugar phosphate isomerase/epimerase